MIYVYLAVRGPARARCLRRDPMPSSRLPWQLLGVFEEDREEEAWQLLHDAQDADFRPQGLSGH